MLERIASLSPEKLALAAQQLAPKVELVNADPVAITGMGCRFPGGADGPDAFWDLLASGVDAVTEVPADRWSLEEYYDPDPDAPGRMYCRHGGFLESVDRFDAAFFGISPREAASLDPQHRLLLETAWEALENAGIDPEGLYGAEVGVFVGTGTFDYAAMQFGRERRDRIDAYFGSGGVPSAAAGRLSYTLGLTGPCFSVDTACSSSLTAVHLACQSLRRRECSLALAAGVNLLLSPELTLNFCKARMLASDGRCKTFDASADGYVRGEGCGVLVLKRLSDALAAGDRVQALVRGSAVNQDGASGGFTVPNGPSQEAVIRRALESGGVRPEQIDYLEAHGTGTSLGDPIEIRSAAKVLCPRGRSRPLLLGSVKTNLGHLEAAAGMAGLVKVVLSLRKEAIPPNLHFNVPNPRIPWEDGLLEAVAALRPWPRGERRRLAGVSAFGFAGTNAHVVLEEAPEGQGGRRKAEGGRTRPTTERDRGSLSPPSSALSPRHGTCPPSSAYFLLPLSAKTPEALEELARRYVPRLDGRLEAADLCYTAAAGRAHFAHRLAVAGPDLSSLRQGLEAFLRNEDSPRLLRGRPVGDPSPVLLFTGQGSQYPGMGRTLYERRPVFRQVLDRCDSVLKDEWKRHASLPGRHSREICSRLATLEHPLLEILHGSCTDLLDRTGCTQPVLFALETALAELWKSRGVEPAAVMGHSVGEYAAAWAAGVFGLEEGLILAAERGRVMQDLPPGGAMASLMASEEEARQALRGREDRLALAAVNGPRSVVVSGAREDVEAVRSLMEAKGIRTAELKVSHAFHSPLMEPALEAFHRAVSRITFSPPRIRLASNVTGRTAGSEVCSSDYWVEHARRPVRFADSMAALKEAGYEVFLEAGPHPLLLGMARACVPGDFGVWLPGLRRDTDEEAAMTDSLGLLYVHGGKVRWSGLYEPCDGVPLGRKVSLPTYPFQRKRFWIDDAPAVSKAPPASWPGERLRLPFSREIRYESRFDRDWPSHLRDHRLFGALVVPGASHLSMALQAMPGAVLESVVFQEPLVLGEEEARMVQLLLTPREGEGSYDWRLASAPATSSREGLDSGLKIAATTAWIEEDEGAWKQHASGVLTKKSLEPIPVSSEKAVDMDSGPKIAGMTDVDSGLKTAGTTGMDFRSLCREGPLLSGQALYESIEKRGHRLGPSFRRVESVWLRDREILCRLNPRPETRDPRPDRDMLVHPGLLDACYQFFCTCGPSSIPPENEDAPPGGNPGNGEKVSFGENLPDVGQGEEALFVPFSLDRVELFRPPREDESLWCLGRVASRGADDLRGDLELLDDEGRTVMELKGFTARKATREGLLRALERGDRGLFYRVQWHPSPVADPGPAGEGPQRWLVFADEGGVGEALARSLEERGHRCLLALAGESFRSLDEGTFELRPGHPEDFDALREESGAEPVDGAVYLWGLDSGETDLDALRRARETACAGLVHWAQETLRSREEPPRLWVVTRGARAVGGEDAPLRPHQAILWGLAQTIALEHPGFRPVCVDLDPVETPPGAPSENLEPETGNRKAIFSLLAETIRPDGEGQTAWRNGARYGARLEPLGAPTRDPGPETRDSTVRSDRTYLVTGGLGALGIETARWLAGKGAGRLVLAGRRGETKAVAQELAALRREGARVEAVAADVSRLEDLTALFQRLQSDDGPPLGGVFHAAGILDDATLSGQSLARLERVMAPKVEGAWNLHLLTRGLPLDGFVLFSSAASLLGSPGQANYAAANAFLDGLAHYRKSLGLPALAVNWSAWAGGGMAATLGRRELGWWTDRGAGLLSPPKALEALGELLNRDEPQVGVLDIRWEKYGERYPGGKIPPFLGLLHRERKSGKESSPAVLSERLRQIPPARHRSFLTDHVRLRLAEVLRLESARSIAPQQGLFDLGLDSLMAVELKNRLESDAGQPLRATLVFDFPTVEGLTSHLTEVLSQEAPSRREERKPVQSPDKAVENNPHDPLGEEDDLDERLARFEKWMDESDE